MKRIIIFIYISAFFFSCNNVEDDLFCPDNLKDSRTLLVNMDSVNFSGLIQIMTCTQGSSIYQGQYIDDTISYYPAFYDVTNGIGQPVNSQLTLKSGAYNLLIWGYPNYSYLYATNAYVATPDLYIGTDLSNSSFSLHNTGFPSPADTLFWPAYDMAVGTQSIDFGSQAISTNLSLITARLNINVSNTNGTAFGTSLDSLWANISGINYQVNSVTGEPLGVNYVTVYKSLTPNASRTLFSTGTYSVFPSMPNPKLQLYMLTARGVRLGFTFYLSNQLSAGTSTTLNVGIYGITFSNSAYKVKYKLSSKVEMIE